MGGVIFDFRFKAHWNRSFTSWYLVPTIRLSAVPGYHWCFVTWLKFDIGFHWSSP